jgi:hypothetical protein
MEAMNSVASVFLVDTLPRAPSRAASLSTSALAYLRIAALTLAIIVAWMGMTVGYFVFLAS